jgi:gliding motility-associated-like protein
MHSLPTHIQYKGIRLFSLGALLMGLFLYAPALIAQPTYIMQTAVVDDCEGKLTDSENGPEEGQYDHNEDYTFTVCVDGATEIIIAFNFFSSEETYDVLAVYDGPNINSPLLAMLTGSIQPPPVLVATSGCVTFHFTSDDNIVAAGWDLDWSVEIDDPEPPALSVVSVLDCPMPGVTFQFDTPVDCDQMSAGNFSILGPGGPAIAQINPLDCMPGELGQVFEVIFASPLASPGTYRLLFNGAIQDACGEWHDVGANVVFELMNCPFNVVINLIDDACAGDCGRVEAEIIGDAGVAYTYIWSHTPLNQDVVDVCTDVAMMVSVTVTDPVSLETATAQYNYIPLENPVILNPVQDTVCASMGDHYYQSSLPGGLYTSAIIPMSLQAEGRYQFWRWNQTLVLNTDLVTYVAPNGCITHDTVYVLPVNAGSIEAACLNSADFTVNGGSPSGGIWQGPHINAAGVFSPVATGSFVVNYTAPNGCIGYKRVNVQDSIIMPMVDTLCSSQEFDLVASPYGGTWSGSGIVNSVLGRVRPWTVTPNQTYTYVYTLKGCTDTMRIFIQELWAGPDQTLCDADSILMLSRPGTWSGPGTYIPALNAFDISALGPGEYDYTISAFGCTDVFRLYIISPYADLYMPVSFCQEDEWIRIGDIADYGPDWGSFTGPTVVENNDEWYFNPLFIGPGLHTIVFEALGCKDSFEIAVEAYAVIPDYSFCELSPAQLLTANPSGGTWAGAGFLDGQAGLFDPQLLGPGLHPIVYTAPSGCVSYDTVEIILREEVSINGVAQIYCFSDTVINVIIAPLDGTFYINGAPSMPSFNPSVLGTGTHELFYTRGSGPCASDERIFFSVSSPIDGMISPPDSICYGENAEIEAAATGGTGSLRASWDQGLGFGFSHIVNPQNTTLYTVTIADGCSEPYIGSALVYVHQLFDIDVVTGPAVCYDDTSYIEIIPPLPDQYAVYWQLDTVFENTYLEGQPGIYTAEVVELFSGCSQTFDVSIPGPPPLSANFSVIPNQSCVDIIDNTVQIIDLSTGYTEGTIDYGDDTGIMPFVQGEQITHDYTQIGEFTITLILANELGCMDTLTRQVCVENRVVMYVPNVFSPNGDGQNDVVKIEAYGLGEVLWSVFSRYGEKVFEANSLDVTWDGTHRGQALDPGVFVVHVVYTDQATGESGERISTVTLVR